MNNDDDDDDDDEDDDEDDDDDKEEDEDDDDKENDEKEEEAVDFKNMFCSLNTRFRTYLNMHIVSVNIKNKGLLSCFSCAK